MQIFEGPMVHIHNNKVKTNMLLIWAGPYGEDVYENLKLPPFQQYNLEAVLRPLNGTVSLYVTFVQPDSNLEL